MSYVQKFSCKPPGHEAARQRENQRRHRARVKTQISELEATLAKTQNQLDDALRCIDSLTAEVERLQHTLQQQDSSRQPSFPDGSSESLDPGIDCPLLPPPSPGESTMTCRDAFSIIRERSVFGLDFDAATEWLQPGFRRAIVPGSGCRVQTHILSQNPTRPHIPTPRYLPSAAMAHPNPLGHLSIGVRDYAVSKAFYSAILAALGLSLVYDSEDPAKGGQTPSSSSGPTPKKKTRTLGFGPDPQHELLNLFEFGPDAAPAPGPGFHLAFNAPTRDAVVEFHAMAVGFGGADNGLPGVRRHYGEDYFAAFVVDPDGWRLEAVCKTPEGAEGE
ncbi:Glyoxalase/Bleomycin resistance protein/Dihydroxybiphenyl dioxygenase [Lasiosphaeris hirsuta]|uniref:Glyoxalase/Bleomycin resistance protein/Dihydroxybiphenyl dioxygenase n=1 Tax=Lasiosphaeris hirsuta TaxID=260670 RepID=A0AA40DN74_9PEZI|nr:Glyoxalase/Bleomycin resistance protein/Dihydroxybiphenyl dioxygenase [Lasiosphaeris hirsuta]